MEYIDVLERHLVIENERIELHLPFEFFPQVEPNYLYNSILEYAKEMGNELYKTLTESEGEERRKIIALIKVMGKYKLLEILRRLVTTSEFQIVLWEKLHKETDFDKSIFLFISPEDISIAPKDISMKDEINMYVNYNAIVDIRDIIDEVGELCDGERENLVYYIQEHVKDSVKETIKMFEEEIYKAFDDSSDDVMEMYENIDKDIILKYLVNKEKID